MTKIEILITAEIREYDDEENEDIRPELEDALRRCINRLAGNNISKKCMHPYLSGVDYEVVYEHEGGYEFTPVIKELCHKCSKLMTPECKGGSQTRLYNHIVSCTAFNRRKTEPIKSD